MKKESIQSRNRKLSIKSRRRRRARSASTGTSMAAAAAAISSVNYNCDRSPAQMLFNLPPTASPLDKRTVTSYLGTGSLSCGLVSPTGNGLSEDQRPPYCPGRYYPGNEAARHFAAAHPSPSSIARYATSGCAAMMGQTGHVTLWGASSPYDHFTGPRASSGIISAMV